MKFVNYKGRKVTELGFWKKFLIGDIREKVSKLALVNWLVTQLRDYEGTKVMEPDFWKKILDLEIFTENLQISPKSDTDIFLKNGSKDVFGLKLGFRPKCLVVFLQFAGPVNVFLFEIHICALF